MFKLEVLDHKARKRAGFVAPTLDSLIPLILTFDAAVECGQGSTDDELSPTCVSSSLGIRIEGVAAGLWHTVCISADGDVYTFGGNQFGQLGTGTDQAESVSAFVPVVNPINCP